MSMRIAVGKDRSPSYQPTPGRRTLIRFDVPEEFLIVPTGGRALVKEEIARGRESYATNCIFIPGTGWELRPLRQATGDAHEAESAQVGVMSKTDLNSPEGTTPIFAATAPGYTGAGATGVAAQSDPMLQKTVAAGDDWGSTSYRLASDESDYQGPHASVGTLDRVAKSADPHDPNTVLHWRFTIPGSSLSSHSIPLRLYFSGPASWATVRSTNREEGWIGEVGSGHYCLSLGGDGMATVLERMNVYSADSVEEDVWLPVHRFRWTAQNKVVGIAHEIHVRPRIFSKKQGQIVGSVTFHTLTDAPPRATGILAAQRDFDSSDISVYRCRQNGPDPSLVRTDARVRMDHRRDLRPMYQIAQARYPDDGRLVTQSVTMNSPHHGGKPIVAVWSGELPAGTSVLLKLIGPEADPRTITGVPATAVYPFEGGCRYEFASVEGCAEYALVVTMTSDPSGMKTPTIERILMFRDHVSREVAPGVFGEDCFWDNVTITGADSSPQQSSATVRVRDPHATMGRLAQRSGHATTIEIEYPGVDWSVPANASKRCVLFRGFVDRPASSPMGDRPKGFGQIVRALWPKLGARSYTVDMNGQWQRASEVFATAVQDFSVDLNDPEGRPYQATRILQILFRYMGYPDDMVDIPDDPLRVWPRLGQGQSLRLSTGANLLEMAVRIARDYLGAALVFDENASGSDDPERWRGMWRLIRPKEAPFTNRVEFLWNIPQGSPPIEGEEGEEPEEPTPALSHVLGAFGTTPGGLPRVQVFGKPSDETIKPEANFIVVTGTGDLSGSGDAQLTATAINYKSYDAVPGVVTSSPDHPDYLGYCLPLIYVSNELGSPEAVRWVLRRLFVACAHARERRTITAPLVLVTDPADPLQRRPRPLRFYDPVLFDGEQWLVRSCSPFYRRDGFQLARYVLEKPRDPFTGYQISAGSS